ncbi:phospholipid-transporting ATPase ID-like isoform X1 [Littorina saxatilis]|uniref:Phospholipid-transporting ATPase n=1 Tax=Littorina saxatilis TaxID=31220 RepID=A0AAN9C4B3_9CAEN
MKPCWAKEKPPEIERRIKVNDGAYNAQFEYAQNIITTSKYNVFTFLPKNLFEQFQRIANAYFLGLLILQLMPVISSLTPLTTIIPLVAVLLVTAAKDAVDDIQRHRSDAQVNNRTSMVLRNGEIVEERWHKVSVGDIIRLKNNDFVAADLMVLSTSEPHSLCYIETAELDGETNLKVRQALEVTSDLSNDHAKMAAFDAEIISEPPNNRLSKFDGKMQLKEQTYSLDNEKILLRGCVLRNTEWCFGVVIFAGRDTKLMMNSGKTKFKRTSIDRFMNKLIIGIFMFLVTMCLICTVACGVWEAVTGHDFQVFLPWEYFIPEAKGSGSTTIALLVFLSYIIILNTVVPISLYVSVEIIRLAHSLWINWDMKMYYDKKDTPAKARTTTLNEELGQIEYIFSDKTGTLTQNIMSFNKCSINGKSYGDPVDREGNPQDVNENTPKVDFSGNPYAEKNFEFYDQELLNVVEQGEQQVHAFFRTLALCHTVMPEVHEDGTLEYQAQSPDEGALVSAARNFGFVFKSRTPSTITIEVNGATEVYDLLCILDFNNVRKRMSVIVKKDNKIKLYCKGADNIIFERLAPACADLKELTMHHLNDFAQSGLRTLCLATKDISEMEYAKWKIKHHAASTTIENRDDRLDEVYEEIETDLELVGASAIEDKLQDGVPETIANLALADIKIWVLTGDKQETAINIGFSCRLLTDEMEEPFIVDAESLEEVEQQLRTALTEVKEAKSGSKSDHVISNGATTYNGATASATVNTDAEMFGEFALVINGHSLAFALKPELEGLFLDLACLCKAVICCRVTPLQKALVVDLVKRHKQTITLAIGDGANDVSMIKMAHIGIGISGQEGLQAVLASDYSISQFRYLERLLLVHGRWSYLRMCKFLQYFFYKNFAFTLCHFWFAFFCGFSAQTLFDPYFISLYNVFYTSLPILVLGIFDQDVDDAHCVRYPKLYVPGIKDVLFNLRVFTWSVIEGLISSLILFFIPYGAFVYSVDSDGIDKADLQSFGTVVAATLVVAVNLRCALDMSYWTGFNHFVVWGSIIYYFCFQLAFYSEAIVYDYVGTSFEVFGNPATWFTMLLTCTILVVPMVVWRFYQTSVNPTLSDRVRLRQRMRKSKSRGRDLTVHRQSTFRRSQRSIRSGYAFAHQAGFGELITSGLNMKERAKEIVTTPVRLTKMLRQNANHVPKKSPTTEGLPVPGTSRSEPGSKQPSPRVSKNLEEPKKSQSTSSVDSVSRPEPSHRPEPSPLPQGKTIFVERL